MVHVLIYVSSATTLYDAAELGEILTVSRRNNSAAGISGMLLYKDGNLMQVLEGDEPVVRALYGRIAEDQRHRGVLVLLDEEQPERQFAEWSMAYRDLDGPDADRVPGYSPFLSTPLTADEFGARPGIAQQLLAIFKATLATGSPAYRL